MALTKAEMAEHLFEKLGINKRDAKDLVELFFEEIKGALESGEQVKLSGFGNFDLRDKNERPGRNPKTGEDIPIKARRVVTFRPGQKLKSLPSIRKIRRTRNTGIHRRNHSGKKDIKDKKHNDKQ